MAKDKDESKDSENTGKNASDNKSGNEKGGTSNDKKHAQSIALKPIEDREKAEIVYPISKAVQVLRVNKREVNYLIKKFGEENKSQADWVEEFGKIGVMFTLPSVK